jgi:hypothetical protein
MSFFDSIKNATISIKGMVPGIISAATPPAPPQYLFMRDLDQAGDYTVLSGKSTTESLTSIFHKSRGKEITEAEKKFLFLYAGLDADKIEGSTLEGKAQYIQNMALAINLFFEYGFKAKQDCTHYWDVITRNFRGELTVQFVAQLGEEVTQSKQARGLAWVLVSMTEVGSLKAIFEQAMTMRDFYECYDGWSSFILINKRDLIDSVTKVYQKMPVFMHPDEKLLSDHPLVRRH